MPEETEKPQTTEQPNLGQRIVAVMRDVKRVVKAKKVNNQYLAVTHDDVAEMVRPLLVKHGIVIVPSLASAQVYETTVKHKGRLVVQYQAEYQITAHNADNLSEQLQMVVPAWADDYGDKHPGKAASYAVKTALLKLFLVPTGESDEDRIDETKYEPELLNASQQVELITLSRDLYGAEGDAKIEALLKRKFPKANSLSMVPAEKFEFCKFALKTNAEKLSKSPKTPEDQAPAPNESSQG